MDEAFELAVAREGEHKWRDEGAWGEDEWLAWEERLALAPGLAAKRALLASPEGRATPDWHYRTAIYTLLEAQALLLHGAEGQDQDGGGGDPAAAQRLLEAKADELDNCEYEIRSRGLYNKCLRLSQRRRLLVLDIAIQLNRPKDEIQRLSMEVADKMNLSLTDAAPADIDTDAGQTRESYPTALEAEHVSTEYILKTIIDELKNLHVERMLRSAAEKHLRTMDLAARELFFLRVYWENAPISMTKRILTRVLDRGNRPPEPDFSAEQRSILLELFLEEYAFECVEVEGYVDMIVEDLKKQSKKSKYFSCRPAHSHLSFPHLQSMLEKEGTLLGGDIRFACRCIQLLQAKTGVAIGEDLDLQHLHRKKIQYDAVESYHCFLKPFSSEVNCLRAALLYQQLEYLRFHGENAVLLKKFMEYVALPRFGADFVNQSFVKKASAGELIVFSNPSYQWRQNSTTQPSTPLRVDEIAQSLGYGSITSSCDEIMCRNILTRLWTEAVLTVEEENQLRKFLASDFLDSLKPECMIKHGRGGLEEWLPRLPKKGAELADWSTKAEIAFCESNPTYFGLEDELELRIRVRNVKTLSVHVYEIRTIDYYNRMRREIRGDLCLDGLLPNYEQEIDLSHLSPWQEARVPVKVYPPSTGRRGVFVVEVFEKDTTCRAILRKGFLRHIEKITKRGHEFTVLDEHGHILSDAKIMVMNLKASNSRAQPPRMCLPDSRGVILVPFRQASEYSGDTFALTLCHQDFGFFSGSFSYLEESYTLDANMYIDNEQLRPGEMAQLLIRPSLTLSQTRERVDLDSLVDIKVLISFASANNDSASTVAKTVEKSIESANSLLNGTCSFEIPMDAKSVNVTLSARVCKAQPKSGGSNTKALPMVSASDAFSVQRLTQFDSTFSLHFLRRPQTVEGLTLSEYYLMVLGHNGEAIKGKKVLIKLKHMHFEIEVEKSLESNEGGEITLGTLQEVQRVAASISGVFNSKWTWELPNLRTYYPQMTNCTVGDQNSIPIPFAYSDRIEEWLSNGQILVCQVIDATGLSSEPVLEDVSHSCAISIGRNDNGNAITVDFVVTSPGDFMLFIRPLELKYPLTTSNTKRNHPTVCNGLFIKQKKLLEATPTNHLVLKSHHLVNQQLEVCVGNANPGSTFVWVVFKRFLDQDNSKLTSIVESSRLDDGGLFGHLASETVLFDNEFLKKRKISDEYTYILQRRAFVQSNPNQVGLLGTTSLPKPTLLQNPVVLDASDMEDLVMREGEKISGFVQNRVRTMGSKSVGGGLESCRRSCPVYSTFEASKSVGSISFLSAPSVVMAVALVDDGIARFQIPESALFYENNSLETVVMALDVNTGAVTSREMLIDFRDSSSHDREIAKRDVRLSQQEALPKQVPSMQVQGHECLYAGGSRTLARTFSSKYAIYDSLDRAMDLWMTLCPASDLSDLVTHLKKWTVMDVKDKLRFYYPNASDDVNFYLYHKDRVFFDRYVKPLVQSKLTKTLLDLYVLEDQKSLSSRYLVPGTFDKLSVVEQLLVAQQQSANDGMDGLYQQVIDLIDEHIETESARDNQLSRIFDTVLSQGSVKPEQSVESIQDQVPVFGAPPAPISRMRPGGGSSFSAQQQSRSVPLSAVFGAPSPAYSPTSPSYTPTSSSHFEGFAYTASSKKATNKKRSSANVEEECELSDDWVDEDDDEDSDNEDFGVRSLDSDGDSESEESEPDSDSNSPDEPENENENHAPRKRKSKPYLLPGKVRRVQEKRFFSTQCPHLDGRNSFWKDFALFLKTQLVEDATTPKRCFLSSHFPEALRSLTEGLLALSVLDLSSESLSTSVRQLQDGTRVQLEVKANSVLFHQGIGAGSVVDDPNTTLIIKQKVVALSDLANTEEDFSDIRSARELVVNRIYCSIVSVSNIGSKRMRNVNLLQQIPQGAIPVTQAGIYTKNELIEVAPGSNRRFQFHFYFPEVGVFQQYPVHAAYDGRIISWAVCDDELSKLVVVLKPTLVDLTSWSDVANRGTLEDVIGFLSKKKNVKAVGLDALSWRCQNELFYLGLSRYLRQRWSFTETIWKFALKHGDVVGIKELCCSSDTLRRDVGIGFKTSLCSWEDLYQHERFDTAFSFDHTEFGPFLTKRAHRVAGTTAKHNMLQVGTNVEAGSAFSIAPRILNKKARDYYRELCHSLSVQDDLDFKQLLVIVYFMILFNRIGDALEVFKRLESRMTERHGGAIDITVGFDYINAYLDFFRPQSGPDRPFLVARASASKYRKHPHPRWQERFERIAEVLEEYDTMLAESKTYQDQGSTAEASKSMHPCALTVDDEVRLDAVINGEHVELKSQNLRECLIAFYRVDVELMFSSEPFDSFSDSASSKSTLLLIEPWRQVRVQLAPGDAPTMNTTLFKIPDELASCQMVLRIREVEASRTVESLAAPIDLTRPYFNSPLEVTVTKQAGLVQVRHQRRLVASCYVKVYAKVTGTSKATFFKDGYTDIVGRFDYAAINGDLLARVEKFSILISHPDLGTIVQQVPPPVLATTSGDFHDREMREALWF